MKNFLVLVFVVLLTQLSTAQERCESQESPVIKDENSISKCSVKYHKKKNKKTSTTGFTIQKVRYLKKRTVKKVAKRKKRRLHLNALGYQKTEDSASLVINLKNNLKNIAYTMHRKEVKDAISFTSIEKIPLFGSCRNSSKKERVDCFNKAMSDHLRDHFEYPDMAIDSETEGNIEITFIIDENGYVSNIKVEGTESLSLLKEEAKRVVSKLPKFVPGEQKGKKVNVKYTFPINFKLN
ncbi:energy transducer TonB [Tenacibaculum sp.]|nr:energy transducer TonB [Tenacibaculum sp.]